MHNGGVLRENDNWPSDMLIQDTEPVFGNPNFKNSGGLNIEDYIPRNTSLIKNRGIRLRKIQDDMSGLKGGLQVEHDILGNKITDAPDMGAIEMQ